MAAKFQCIESLAFDTQGNLLVADDGNVRLRRVRFDTTPPTVEDVAGNGQRDTVDGTLLSTSFKSLSEIAVSQTTGAVYVTSNWADHVRKVDLDKGLVTVWRSWIDSIIAVAVFPATDEVYVSAGSQVKRNPTDGSNLFATAGDGTQGYKDAYGTGAQFSSIFGLAFSATGEVLFIADSLNNCIRKYTVSTREVTTVAGLCDMYTRPLESVDGDSTSARFARPAALAVGPNGTLYIADVGGSVPRVRRIEIS